MTPFDWLWKYLNMARDSSVGKVMTFHFFTTRRPTRVPPSILDPGQGVPGVPASGVKQPELETGHLCLAPALKENVRTYLRFPVHLQGVIKRHRSNASSIEWPPRRVASLRARRGTFEPFLPPVCHIQFPVPLRRDKTAGACSWQQNSVSCRDV